MADIASVTVAADFEPVVAAVRRFSRFYTRRIGLLHEGLLGGPLSLPEGRLLYEIAQHKTCTAAELNQELDLDSGYLSRLVRGLEDRGLVTKTRSDSDGRHVLVSLTQSGRDAFAAIDDRSREEVGSMLQRLAPAQQRRLATALGEAEMLLGGADRGDDRTPYALRSPQPGDMGWIVHRQAVLYAHEYGWDSSYEALIAEIIAGFMTHFKPDRERCWIAERDGIVAGSIFLVYASHDVAKLRLLYVEPSARGLGIGKRLVDECIAAARGFGYRTLTLWTNDILSAARRIYEEAGFTLAREERHRSFGHDLVGQNWELAL